MIKAGKTIIFNGDKRKCQKCKINSDDHSSLSKLTLPKIVNNSERVISDDTAYQMTSFNGSNKKGTAKNINIFDYQIVEKTGTTNENQDAFGL